MEAIIFDWTGTLHERHKGLFSFTKKVLNELKKKYKFGILSRSNNIEKRKDRIENSEIRDYFNVVMVVDKKNTKSFNELINKLGTEPSSTIIVGDRASRDIGPGNKLGCRTVWIQKGDRSWDKPNEETGEPTYKIDSIKELLTIL